MYLIPLCFLSTLNAGAQTECAELIHYRDVVLVQTWDNLHEQLAFNQRELQDYKNWKATLENDYTGVSAGTLLSAIKGISNLITNTFELVTPTGKVVNIAKNVSAETLDKINTVKAINGKIGDVQALYEGGIAALMKKRVTDQLGMVGSLYTKINTLVEDLHEFNDFVESRNEIKRMLAEFDALITKSEALVKNSHDNIGTFNSYVNYITEYLNSNCGN